MPNDKQRRQGKRNLKKIRSEENLKYLSRSFYYGTLKDYDWVGEALVLKMNCFTATAWSATNSVVRVYVPTDLEHQIIDYLECGSNYFLVTAPYSVRFQAKFNHKVDLLLNIFKEITE